MCFGILRVINFSGSYLGAHHNSTVTGHLAVKHVFDTSRKAQRPPAFALAVRQEEITMAVNLRKTAFCALSARFFDIFRRNEQIKIYERKKKTARQKSHVVL